MTNIIEHLLYAILRLGQVLSKYYLRRRAHEGGNDRIFSGEETEAQSHYINSPKPPSSSVERWDSNEGHQQRGHKVAIPMLHDPRPHSLPNTGWKEKTENRMRSRPGREKWPVALDLRKLTSCLPPPTFCRNLFHPLMFKKSMFA